MGLSFSTSTSWAEMGVGFPDLHASSEGEGGTSQPSRLRRREGLGLLTPTPWAEMGLDFSTLAPQVEVGVKLLDLCAWANIEVGLLIFVPRWRCGLDFLTFTHRIHFILCLPPWQDSSSIDRVFLTHTHRTYFVLCLQLWQISFDMDQVFLTRISSIFCLMSHIVVYFFWHRSSIFNSYISSIFYLAPPTIACFFWHGSSFSTRASQAYFALDLSLWLVSFDIG